MYTTDRLKGMILSRARTIFSVVFIILSIVPVLILVDYAHLNALILSQDIERYLYLLGYLLLLAATIILRNKSENSRQNLESELTETRSQLKRIKQLYDNVLEEQEYLKQFIQTSHSELELARQHACECNDNKSMFLANVSHEIRTPLNAIMGYVELLMIEEPQANHVYLENIQRGSKQLLDLIDDLLDLSRLEAGICELNNQAVRLNQLLNDSCELLLPLVNQKNLDFIPLIHESVHVEAMLDAHRLQQIITNLLINAINYTPKGHISMCCRLLDDHELEIEISDTGLGMSETQIEQLFEPFVRHHVHNTSHKGSGLGMAICHELIQLLGGKLNVLSKVHQGTIMTLKLPLTGLQSTTAQRTFLPGKTYLYHSEPLCLESMKHILSPVSEQLVVLSSPEAITFINHQDNDRYIVEHSHKPDDQPGLEIISIRNKSDPLPARSDDYLEFPLLYSALEAHFSRPQTMQVSEQTQIYGTQIYLEKPVLIVDDRPENLELIEAYLSQLGIDYISTHSGIAALEVYREQAFSVVFMDIRMPVLDGIETCRLMRQVTEHSCQIIALTACATNDEKEKIKAAGFDNYLSKPISLDTLKAILHQISKYLNNCSPGINWNASLEICAGDEALAQRMLHNLLDNIPEMLQRLQSGNEDLDPEVIHQWAGLISYTGANHLKELVRKLESGIRSKPTTNIEHLISRTCNELVTVMTQGLRLATAEDSNKSQKRPVEQARKTAISRQ